MRYGQERLYKEYRNNEISTSNQGKLIIMMYDGAIKNINLAIEACKNKDISSKGLHIRKAHDIINELSLALDEKKGGEIAVRLEQLYQFILKQLSLANMKRDNKSLKSTLNILIMLREAWEEVIQKESKSDKPAENPQVKRIAAHC